MVSEGRDEEMGRREVRGEIGGNGGGGGGGLRKRARTRETDGILLRMLQMVFPVIVYYTKFMV